MRTVHSEEKMVSVIVPAYNESATIGSVVCTALSHPLVDEVIVVDDGSSDATVEVALEAGAKVISKRINRGKAGAMETGVRQSKNSILFFIDADILGLTHDMMSLAISSVQNRASDLFVLIVDYSAFGGKFFIHRMPLVGGVRVLRRRIWDAVPEEYKKGFQIELAMNFFARRQGARISKRMMPGLSQVIKEKKHGLLVGFFQRVRMFRDLCLVFAKLYFLHPFKESRRKYSYK